MSDPVTNAEVEDVLSSIRRLVSEEKRPLQSTKAATQNDRLVLTAALRVAETDSPNAPPKENHAETADEVDLQEVDTVAQVEDTFADPDDSAPIEQSFDDPAIDATDEDNPQELSEDDDGADSYTFDSEDNFQEDDLTEEAFADPQTVIEEASDDKVSEIESAEGDGAKDEAAEVEGAEPFDAKAAALSSKIEALEVALGEIEDDFEPEEVVNEGESSASSLAMEWEDDLGEDNDLLGKPSAAKPGQDTSNSTFEDAIIEKVVDDCLVEDTAEETSTTQEEEHSFAFNAEDHVIDEEALRDLVSEIVREELQGALGERITRNVRKLVRREIHRALATQDLE